MPKNINKYEVIAAVIAFILILGSVGVYTVFFFAKSTGPKQNTVIQSAQVVMEEQKDPETPDQLSNKPRTLTTVDLSQR